MARVPGQIAPPPPVPDRPPLLGRATGLQAAISGVETAIVNFSEARREQQARFQVEEATTHISSRMNAIIEEARKTDNLEGLSDRFAAEMDPVVTEATQGITASRQAQFVFGQRAKRLVDTTRSRALELQLGWETKRSLAQRQLSIEESIRRATNNPSLESLEDEYNYLRQLHLDSAPALHQSREAALLDAELAMAQLDLNRLAGRAERKEFRTALVELASGEVYQHLPPDAIRTARARFRKALQQETYGVFFHQLEDGNFAQSNPTAYHRAIDRNELGEFQAHTLEAAYKRLTSESAEEAKYLQMYLRGQSRDLPFPAAGPDKPEFQKAVNVGFDYQIALKQAAGKGDEVNDQFYREFVIRNYGYVPTQLTNLILGNLEVDGPEAVWAMRMVQTLEAHSPGFRSRLSKNDYVSKQMAKWDDAAFEVSKGIPVEKAVARVLAIEDLSPDEIQRYDADFNTRFDGMMEKEWPEYFEHNRTDFTGSPFEGDIKDLLGVEHGFWERTKQAAAWLAPGIEYEKKPGVHFRQAPELFQKELRDIARQEYLGNGRRLGPAIRTAMSALLGTGRWGPNWDGELVQEPYSQLGDYRNVKNETWVKESIWTLISSMDRESLRGLVRPKEPTTAEQQEAFVRSLEAKGYTKITSNMLGYALARMDLGDPDVRETVAAIIDATGFEEVFGGATTLLERTLGKPPARIKIEPHRKFGGRVGDQPVYQVSIWAGERDGYMPVMEWREGAPREGEPPILWQTGRPMVWTPSTDESRSCQQADAQNEYEEAIVSAEGILYVPLEAIPTMFPEEHKKMQTNEAFRAKVMQRRAIAQQTVGDL